MEFNAVCFLSVVEQLYEEIDVFSNEGGGLESRLCGGCFCDLNIGFSSQPLYHKHFMMIWIIACLFGKIYSFI